MRSRGALGRVAVVSSEAGKMTGGQNPLNEESKDVWVASSNLTEAGRRAPRKSTGRLSRGQDCTPAPVVFRTLRRDGFFQGLEGGGNTRGNGSWGWCAVLVETTMCMRFIELH